MSYRGQNPPRAIHLLAAFVMVNSRTQADLEDIIWVAMILRQICELSRLLHCECDGLTGTVCTVQRVQDEPSRI